MVETTASADIYIFGVKMPMFQIGCAFDTERKAFVDAVNAWALARCSNRSGA